LPDGVRIAVRKVACGFLDLLFPDDCRVCGEALHEVSRIPVCGRCLRQPTVLVSDTSSPEGVKGLDAVYSFGAYEGPLRKLIHLFKYEGVRPLAKPFGEFLALVLPREQQFDVVVPLPLHWRRLFHRRFNQAGLLAREIARRWNVPLRNAMRRTKFTPPQAGLTSAQRRLNMQGAFAPRRKGSLKGLRVLLVDDVLTTGATAGACARALKRAGAAHVTLLTLARRDRRLAREVEVMI